MNPIQQNQQVHNYACFVTVTWKLDKDVFLEEIKDRMPPCDSYEIKVAHSCLVTITYRLDIQAFDAERASGVKNSFLHEIQSNRPDCDSYHIDSVWLVEKDQEGIA